MGTMDNIEELPHCCHVIFFLSKLVINSKLVIHIHSPASLIYSKTLLNITVI